jgi:hypothetical protein
MPLVHRDMSLGCEIDGWLCRNECVNAKYSTVVADSPHKDIGSLPMCLAKKIRSSQLRVSFPIAYHLFRNHQAWTDAALPSEASELFVRPTVLLEQPEDSKVMKEEIFGPVVAINTFKSEEDALRKANDTEYGLYAAVFTKDLDRAMRIAKGFESGMVGVNCTSPTGAWDMPFGGYKQSGLGRESFLLSMDNWLENKSVYVKVNGLLPAAPTTNGHGLGR